MVLRVSYRHPVLLSLVALTTQSLPLHFPTFPPRLPSSLLAPVHPAPCVYIVEASQHLHCVEGMKERWLLLAGAGEGLVGLWGLLTKVESLIRDSVGVGSGPGVRVRLHRLLAVCLGTLFDPSAPPFLHV